MAENETIGTIGEYKKILDKEAFDLALTLSPGVKLKAIMSKSDEINSNTENKLTGKIIHQTRKIGKNKTINPLADDEGERIVDKKEAARLAIYDLLESISIIIA